MGFCAGYLPFTRFNKKTFPASFGIGNLAQTPGNDEMIVIEFAGMGLNQRRISSVGRATDL